MIDKSNLITEVKYFGAKKNEEFRLIGYVQIMHDGNLVFHQVLTERGIGEVTGLSAEEIQALAQTEAGTILATEEANKAQDDYITLVNLGLYGAQ